ncbi:MAG: hypothetical protein AUK55_15450 [Syntrophobacteraceae bacterium CG2_30_61_12]|nr:MAG: hypothetical protein AUK55_15450 [Syntrophobacteraceae bacterium CG2_30_61_12]
MNNEIHRLQDEARRIASRNRQPEFYQRFQADAAAARKLYFDHPLVLLLRELVEPLLNDDLGHGLSHSRRVSLDCATLIGIEANGSAAAPAERERWMVLGHLAGLMHDICREQPRHAIVGAREAAKILDDFPVSREEIRWICRAIENHEAFVPPLPCPHPFMRLLSDCLYDADKFRWGPDTFTETLWHMMDHQCLTPTVMLARFPWGVRGVERVRDTFRSDTGRQYGPDFIEIGIDIGREIYRYLLKHYGATELGADFR